MAGTYENLCGSGCLYGSASIDTSISANVEISACCCVKVWGTDHCSPKIGVKGSASIGFSSSVRYNQCAACDGRPHGEITLDDIILSGEIDIGIWSGSYSYPIYP